MTPLIFLPGASGSLEFWHPLMALLPERYSKHIIGYPGFGSVPMQESVYDFDSLSRHVLAQVDQPCIIIAQSMGGILALQAALQKPELVKGLVLIATSGGIDLSPFQVEDWRSAYKNQFLNYPDWFAAVHLDYASQLSKIKQEVLLLWGDADLISPVAVGRYLNQKFQHSTLHIIQHGDHLFAAQHASEVAEFVTEYLHALESSA